MGQGALTFWLVPSFLLTWMVFYCFSFRWKAYSFHTVWRPSWERLLDVQQQALERVVARAFALAWVNSHLPPVLVWPRMLEFDWSLLLSYPFAMLRKFAFLRTEDVQYIIKWNMLTLWLSTDSEEIRQFVTQVHGLMLYPPWEAGLLSLGSHFLWIRWENKRFTLFGQTLGILLTVCHVRRRWAVLWRQQWNKVKQEPS